MKPLLDLFSRFGVARLAAMGAVTLTLIGFFGFIMLRVSQPTLGVLYADLPGQDAGAVLRELEARGVRYETRGEGNQTILAPRGDIPRLRMDLAGKGLPSGGGVGYEIFDKGDAFSSTNFVQNVNHLRALEGELARSVQAIGRVQAARVHLVIPERRLFARDEQAPSASIVLRLAGDLDAGQVRAVRHLVASAVANLKPERISIVDERGRLLADGAQGGDAQAGAVLDERQAAIERRLKGQVEEIVAGVVGLGRARVQVSAELDVNRVESRSESYDPESRVVRSTQTRSEQSSTASPDGAVSVGNELPSAKDNAPNGGNRDNANKNEETTNYEISRTTKTEVLESGRLKRLSVAVLVDGAYAKGASGTPAYQPRPKEELDRIAALVRTAVGFDKARGDQVEVVNLRFAEAPSETVLPEENLLGSLIAKPSREDVLRLIELGVLAILTFIVLLTVVRPLLRRVLEPEPVPPAVAALAAAVGGVAAAGAAGGTLALAEEPREHPAARLVEFAKINGQIQAQTVERVVEMVRANPSETVEVLRNWINEQ